MREVLRVLKPGGALVVIAEAYGKNGRLEQWVMKLLLKSSCFSVEEERGLFSAAGYAGVQVFEERKKGWLCAVGRKP
jgi:hypothetical protein